MRNFTRIALCALAFATTHAALAYDFEAGGVYYNITSPTTVEVTYRDADFNSYGGDMTLGGKVTNEGTTYDVTAVGEQAFYGSNTVTNVRIGESIQKIGAQAFLQCENLTTVYMAEPAALEATSFSFADVTLYVPELMKDGFLDEEYYSLFKEIIETDEFDAPVGSKTLVLTEIFFTGTTTPEGKQYSDDQYFKVGNNSDEVLYLDGYAFVESAFMTVDKQDYTPDIMNEAMTIQAIYVFPGSGTDYPIQPGEEKIVAINAINHLELNPGSFDLSTADFEIYDESENPNFQDSQNPDVPDMVNWYDYSYSYFSMHNRGFHSYALAKPEVDMETYVSDYYYEYTYLFVFGEYSFDMDGDGYKLPNSWIVDAVNLSVQSDWQWNVVAPTLDSGWAHCGSMDHDLTRYGKSVIRRKGADGKWIDTNNSTADFISDAPASLLSQSSAIETLGADRSAQAAGIYSIDGRRVPAITRPGLYIIGGKKVFVK